MGVTREVRLQERSARARLAPRHHPYWRTISEGAHLGYYRGARAGKWIARYRKPASDEPYATVTLGMADDAVEADGEAVLNYKQALDGANEWIKHQASGGATLDPNLTVRDAVDAYIAVRNARATAQAGRKKKSSASYTLTSNVLSDRELSGIKLRDLNEANLRDWQRGLPAVAATTKQRILSDFKAALNLAFEEHRRVLPTDLPVTIKYGLKRVFVDEQPDRPAARDNQILTDEQIRKILATAEGMDEDGDHYLLSLLLAATGARFSQVIRMRVEDVQPELSRVLVPPSRKGKGKEAKFITVQVGSDVLRRLKKATKDREKSGILLERWRYRQIKPTEWERVGRGPWHSSSEMLRWWTKVVEAAGLPGVIPYALRHSSIVRAIRNGLPIRLVAALHDTSVTMIEKHYSRWIAESLDELAARAVVPLVKAA
jgi:integrase